METHPPTVTPLITPGQPDENGDPVLDLHFHPGQLAAWNSKKRVILLLAGSRGGKTSFAALWLYNEIATCGPGDYLVAAPDYKLIDKAAGPEIKKVFSTIHDLGKTREHPWEFRMSSAGEKLLWNKTQDVPTRIIFGHADDPDSLAAMTVKAAWLDEAGARKFKAGSWEEIYTRRTAINKGRILISTTPYCFNWLKTELYDKWKAAGKNHPEIDVFQFASTMNPAFDMEEDEKARQNLPKWRYEMMFRGMFTKPAGTIYDVFDEPPHKHKVPRFDIPLDWPRYVGLDFGGVNTAAVYLAEDPSSGKLYAYREYHTGRRSAAEHIWYLRQGEPDFSKVAGGSKSEGQWRMEFQAGGVTTHGKVEGMNVLVPDIRAGAGSEVEVGINRVYGAFQRDELFVFDDLTELCDELSTYSRVLDDRLEPTEVIDEKETYHLCLAEGTLIETDSGSVPIEAIRVGDLVRTRSGYRPVTAKMCSGLYFVKAVVTESGNLLAGTGNHPVWVENSGFTDIDTLRCGDTLLTRPILEESACRNCGPTGGKQSSTSGNATTATPTRNIPQPACTTRESAGIFTESSGRTTTASPSRKEWTSTIRTAMSTTTPSKILRSFIRAITAAITTLVSALRHSGRTLKGFARKRTSGIGQPPGDSGTSGRQGSKTSVGSWRTGPALTAASSTSAGPGGTTHDSAPSTVGLPPVTRAEWTTCNGNASAATIPLPSTDTRNSGTAPDRVRQVIDFGAADVFNLEVAVDHEYFANGILVSNCDALRYIVGHLKRGGQRVRFHVMDPNAAREQIVAAQAVKPPEEGPRIAEHTQEEIAAEIKRVLEKEKQDFWKKMAGEEEPGGFVDGWSQWR